MDDIFSKVNKAFSDGNELCLSDECPKDITCGECWNREIKRYGEIEYNKAIDDFVNAYKEDILFQTFGMNQQNIEKIAEQLKKSEVLNDD